jgi:hypothetical protein
MGERGMAVYMGWFGVGGRVSEWGQASGGLGEPSKVLWSVRGFYPQPYPYAAVGRGTLRVLAARCPAVP